MFCPQNNPASFGNCGSFFCVRAVFALRSFFAAPRSARQSVRGMDVGCGFTLFCNRPSVRQPPAREGNLAAAGARRLAGVALCKSWLLFIENKPPLPHRRQTRPPIEAFVFSAQYAALLYLRMSPLPPEPRIEQLPHVNSWGGRKCPAPPRAQRQAEKVFTACCARSFLLPRLSAWC